MLQFYRDIQINKVERKDHEHPDYWIVRFDCQFKQSELPEKPGYTHFKVGVLYNRKRTKIESMHIQEEIPCENDDDLEKLFLERIQRLYFRTKFDFHPGIYSETYGMEHLNESQKT